MHIKDCLIKVKQLPLGVSSAPPIFQRTVESLVGDVPGVVSLLDDILVTGSSDIKHWKRLDEDLIHLEHAGLRLKRSKCELKVPEVLCLGHKITAEGILPVKESGSHSRFLPPMNATDLQAYLRLLKYCHRFLPNASALLAPLHELLRKRVVWRWGKQQQEAFESSKRLF